MVRTRVREWSHPHMRSLNDRRTLTIVSVTSIAVVQEVLDYADMQILLHADLPEENDGAISYIDTKPSIAHLHTNTLVV